MTPRIGDGRLAGVGHGASTRLGLFRETREKAAIPLFGEHRDDIVGILYAKDLFPLFDR